MEMAPKSKAHIRSVMHLMFECASRWELFNDRRNPIEMVRVKDSTKRQQRPTVLTVPQYESILAVLKEPVRTMVIVAQCLGLRVQRDCGAPVARLRLRTPTTPRSTEHRKREGWGGEDGVFPGSCTAPIRPLWRSLLEWSKRALPTEDGWVFASPYKNMPYHPTEIQKRHIRPAGSCLVQCPTCGARVGVWCWQDKPTPNGARLPITKSVGLQPGSTVRSVGTRFAIPTGRGWTRAARR